MISGSVKAWIPWWSTSWAIWDKIWPWYARPIQQRNQHERNSIHQSFDMQRLRSTRLKELPLRLRFHSGLLLWTRGNYRCPVSKQHQTLCLCSGMPYFLSGFLAVINDVLGFMTIAIFSARGSCKETFALPIANWYQCDPPRPPRRLRTFDDLHFSDRGTSRRVDYKR